MPVHESKPITSSPKGPTPESSSAIPLEQEEFHQHLRRLVISAVQVLLEQVMREELEQCIGASWGECTPTRRGYRNGGLVPRNALYDGPGYRYETRELLGLKWQDITFSTSTF